MFSLGHQHPQKTENNNKKEEADVKSVKRMFYYTE